MKSLVVNEECNDANESDNDDADDDSSDKRLQVSHSDACDAFDTAISG